MAVTLSDTHTYTTNRLKIERRGSVVQQTLVQNITKDSNGAIQANWSVSLSSLPQKGEARWLPADPNKLHISILGGKGSSISIDSDVLLWPPDADKAMRKAAQEMIPLQLTSFTYPFSAVSRLVLLPEKPDPIGIFAGAIRFVGTLSEGSSTSQVTCWICPAEGQIKQVSTQGGLIIITQRKEIPPPSDTSGQEFFEWTLCRLPHIPFLSWRNEIRVKGLPDLPAGLQKVQVDAGEYILNRADPPNEKNSKQLPIRLRAKPDPEDERYLADSPLLGINDLAITGLIARLNINPLATRWDICCKVNTFVFEFIRNKGLDVGFATALEVARNPSGDCTEHTVLAVALLRRLGVPARATFGWAGTDDSNEIILGLHAWVEAKIGQDWIPLDPTFDQAPAGTFRVPLSNSDLSSIAEINWGTGAIPVLSNIALVITVSPLTISENEINIDDINLRLLTGKWICSDGKYFILHPQLGNIIVSGSSRRIDPPDSKLIRVPGMTSVRFSKSATRLAIDCGKNRWLYLEGLTEVSAMRLLKVLKISYTNV
ncbi:MAG: lasso peptide biosynthesis protein [Holophagaceae bacterium]|nr:lasso peptide biosynthesis protein [Holophagaceae bacterium]